MPLIKTSDAVVEDPVEPVGEMDGEDLTLALHSDNLHERRNAVRMAVRAGHTALLVARLGAETDPSVREAILTGLMRCGNGAQALPLLDLLRSEDVLLRSAVIETLQTMGDALLPEIEALLSDPDPDIRIFSVNILQAVHSPRVPDIALRVALTDENVNVCCAAVEILAELARPEMNAPLREVAARFPHQPFLAFAVRAALSRLG